MPNAQDDDVANASDENGAMGRTGAETKVELPKLKWGNPILRRDWEAFRVLLQFEKRLVKSRVPSNSLLRRAVLRPPIVVLLNVTLSRL